MKKFIASALAAAILLSFCSCMKDGAENEIMITDRTSDLTASAVSSSAAAPQDTAPEYEAEWTPNSGLGYIEDYITIASKEWDCGFIEYPVFNEQSLYPDDAKAANALFEQVIASFEKNVENEYEYDMTYGWGYVDCSIYGNVLSVMMQYKYFYSYPGAGSYVKAVNFNLETGRAMTPEEVIKAASYTEEDVEESLRWYVREYMTNRERYKALYGFYEYDFVPMGVKEVGSLEPYTEYSVNIYRSENDEFTDLDADALRQINIPFYPAVHIDYAGVLYAETKITDNTVGRLYNKMAAVGHDETERALFNNRNSFDPLTRSRSLSADGAEEAVYTYFNQTAEFDPDVYYNYPVEYVDCIGDEYDPENNEMAFVVSVCTEDEDKDEGISVVKRYAVGILNNIMWEEDADGNWQNVFRYIVDYADACDRNALGVICLYPSEYDEFLANPLADAKVTSSDDYILVGPTYEGTTVSILHGSLNGDGTFERDDILFQTVLNPGEWIRVYCPRVTRDDASMAIEFATGFDKGTFVYTGANYDNICYVFTDEAVG